MIELNWWVLLILVLGSVVVAFGLFFCVALAYHLATGNPVKLHWGPAHLHIDDGSE